ncbi:YtxH domain-containing protein [Dyadobacter sp. 32]|uniref:YtxH domain-containing protein n=1 Tax=Dyadobacter sp. 32 TaxID=538966 RepID=UPI0011EC46C5
MASNRVFLGIVTAVAAGVVIGLLFAPEDGNKMRKKIKKRTNSLASELIEALEKSKAGAERLKSEGEEYKDEVLDTAQGAKDKFLGER